MKSHDKTTSRSDDTLIIPLSFRQEKRSESVARAILHDVRSRKLTPGTLLEPEAAMLAEYGVARTTLREALRLLEFNGLIGLKTGPGGGPYLTEPSAAALGRILTLHLQAIGVTLGDLIDARAAFEITIAGEAASCTDPDARERLVRSAAAHIDGGAEFDDSGTDFHECVIGMASNPILRAVGGALFDVVRLRVRTSLSSRQLAQVRRDHAAISDAILAGDAEEAQRQTRVHFDRINTYLVANRFDLTQSVEWM